MPVRLHQHTIPPVRLKPRPVNIWETNPAVPFNLATVMDTEEELIATIEEDRKVYFARERRDRRTADIVKATYYARFGTVLLVRHLLTGADGELNLRRKLQYAESLHRRKICRGRDAWQTPLCPEEVEGCETSGRFFTAADEEWERDSHWRRWRETMSVPYHVEHRMRQGRAFRAEDPFASPGWVVENAYKAGLVSTADDTEERWIKARRKCLQRWEEAEQKARHKVCDAERAGWLRLERDHVRLMCEVGEVLPRMMSLGRLKGKRLHRHSSDQLSQLSFERGRPVQ
eukprot:Hpha_TRINITY_DN30285_c0_g1::TRINITY_DN30285_c0_g1_i1::g.27194::m.27194